MTGTSTQFSACPAAAMVLAMGLTFAAVRWAARCGRRTPQCAVWSVCHPRRARHPVALAAPVVTAPPPASAARTVGKICLISLFIISIIFVDSCSADKSCEESGEERDWAGGDN